MDLSKSNRSTYLSFRQYSYNVLYLALSFIDKMLEFQWELIVPPPPLTVICFYFAMRGTSFLDLNLSIHNDTVSTKIYDIRDDFDIVNFPLVDGDVPRRPSYGVFIAQLIRFARVSSQFTDLNNRNRFLTAKLLKQGYRYHTLQSIFQILS